MQQAHLFPYFWPLGRLHYNHDTRPKPVCTLCVFFSLFTLQSTVYIIFILKSQACEFNPMLQWHKVNL